MTTKEKKMLFDENELFNKRVDVYFGKGYIAKGYILEIQHNRYYMRLEGVTMYAITFALSEVKHIDLIQNGVTTRIF